jgi:hypothetical protein
MLHTKSFLTAVTAATLAIGLTACGGGGGGAVPSTSGPVQPGAPQAQPATAQMTINIPGKTSAINHRNPKYISVSTQSMTIGLVAGTKTTQLSEIDLTPSSPHCSALAGGGTQCNATFVGTAGTATYALSMYSGTGGTGNLLSTGDVQATLVAGQNTTVPIALDGVPSTVALVLGAASLPVGTASSTGVFVQAQDASGNIIVGPGGFSTAISLAVAGDTYKTLALSSTSVISPGQVVTLSYTGGTNVGSTITPSIGSAAGSAANFAGSGGAITYIAPTLQQSAGSSTSSYPYDITALPNSSAAFILDEDVCCSTVYVLGTTTIGGVQKYFVGDTSDPYNPGTATSIFASSPGVTVVHGMAASLVAYGDEQYHNITSDTSGNVYYGGSFTSTNASNGCGGGGGTLSSGTIGKLSPSAGTTTEKVLKGQPWYLHTDNSGNIWFLEQSGTCNGTPLLSSGYGVGELTASGTLTETDFATAGISTSVPRAMSISPDGSEMYIAESTTITKIAIPALTSPSSITPTNSASPYSIATGPDQTTLWFADDVYTGDGLYYYGYIQGTKSFASANIAEAVFPEVDSYSYDAVFADGSFFGGNDETGFMRIAGAASGAPQYVAYPSLYYNEPLSVDAGSGYIWGADDDYGTIMALQYGALSSATQTMITHRVGNINTTRRNAKAVRKQ